MKHARNSTARIATAALCGAIAIAAALLPVGCATGNGVDAVDLDPSYYTDKYDYDNADTFLGRGINLGNFLEAPPTDAYPTGEGNWNGGVIAAQDDFTRMAALGFKNVRIPVKWSAHASPTAPYTIKPEFMARVKEVVGYARAANLIVVLNVHHYSEMFSDPATALPGHRERLKAIWDQLCDAFPETDPLYAKDVLVFELLNEPNATVGATEWNAIVAELAKVIWTDNGATQANRKIMVGTAKWGGFFGLADLSLPPECTPANTIVTVHCYDPFRFTHQGAEWAKDSSAWIGTTWTGTQTELDELTGIFALADSWKANGYEVYLGEFGVYPVYAKPSNVKAWTAFIAREAERRGMSWAYWEYCAGLGAYDHAAAQWKPNIVDALIPAVDRPAQ